MRMPARSRDRSDIDELLDAVRRQQRDELIERVRRVSDGVDHRLWL
jgi:hypothetical protein